MLLHDPQSPLRAITVRAAREYHAKHGRGLLLARFRDSTVASLQPPIYIPISIWEKHPPFPQFEILRTLREYNPATQFVQVAVGPDSKHDRIGRYAYWIVELAESEMQS